VGLWCLRAAVHPPPRQLRRAIPLANIDVVPNGAQSVILTGYVGRVEDIQLAQQVVAGLGFQALNGLRVNGVQQVQLDVVIARVVRTKNRNFGFNFLITARQNIFGSTVGNLTPTVQINPVGVPSAVLQPSQFGQTISSAPGAANIFGGIIGNAAGFLAFLQALEVEGLAKLLAQPRLTTLSGNPASFLDGGEQAVPVPAGLGQVGVQFEEFGTRLNFLPVVLGNGRIHLEVEPEVSVLDASAGTNISGATVPGRVTQRVHTTVELETGQTFVIGGLIQRTTLGNAQKVPVLGQLPFVGALFSTKSFAEAETELVVMVTPHLVDAQSACQVVKVLPGQETRTPDDFELFLEGILEAPRGPRAVFHNNRYVPAFRNGPTATLFPCAGQTDGCHSRGHGHGHHGGACGAADGGCAAPAAPVNGVAATVKEEAAVKPASGTADEPGVEDLKPAEPPVADDGEEPVPTTPPPPPGPGRRGKR
jgi:pilus assembly protein CpaC